MKQFAGTLYGLAGFTFFSIHDVIIKVLSSYYLPIQIIFFTSLIAVPIALFLIASTGDLKSLRPVYPKIMLARVIILSITGICVFFAISTIPLAEVYALLFSSPIIITALSVPILSEQVGWRRWIAVMIGFCGVLIILQPNVTIPQLGHLAAISAAFGISVNSIFLRKFGTKEQGGLVLLYPLIGNIVIMGVLLPLVYVPMPLEHLGLLSLVSIFSIIAMGFLIFAYRVSEAALVAPMQYSQMIWGIIIGWLLFAETVETHVLVGAIIIIFSGIFIFLREVKKNVPSSITERPI